MEYICCTAPYFCHILTTVVKYGETRMLQNVECITVIQKRVVRLVCGARRLDHTGPLFKQLGILKFIDLVKFKTSIIMFKAYHNELPGSLQKMFNLHVQKYDTRHKYTFSVHRAHTNIKSMCISIYGVKLWNSLHTNLNSIGAHLLVALFVRPACKLHGAITWCYYYMVLLCFS